MSGSGSFHRMKNNLMGSSRLQSCLSIFPAVQCGPAHRFAAIKRKENALLLVDCEYSTHFRVPEVCDTGYSETTFISGAVSPHSIRSCQVSRIRDFLL